MLISDMVNKLCSVQMKYGKYKESDRLHMLFQEKDKKRGNEKSHIFNYKLKRRSSFFHVLLSSFRNVQRQNTCLGFNRIDVVAVFAKTI